MRLAENTKETHPMPYYNPERLYKSLAPMSEAEVKAGIRGLNLPVLRETLMQSCEGDLSFIEKIFTQPSHLTKYIFEAFPLDTRLELTTLLKYENEKLLDFFRDREPSGYGYQTQLIDLADSEHLLAILKTLGDSCLDCLCRERYFKINHGMGSYTSSIRYLWDDLIIKKSLFFTQDPVGISILLMGLRHPDLGITRNIIDDFCKGHKDMATYEELVAHGGLLQDPRLQDPKILRAVMSTPALWQVKRYDSPLESILSILDLSERLSIFTRSSMAKFLERPSFEDDRFCALVELLLKLLPKANRDEFIGRIFTEETDKQHIRSMRNSEGTLLLELPEPTRPSQIGLATTQNSTGDEAPRPTSRLYRLFGACFRQQDDSGAQQRRTNFCSIQ